MAIKVGSARNDENGKISGGAAGDQTGREVMIQDYYLHTKGWYMLRPKSVADANAIAQAMTDACNNNNIGYDQGNRLGVITQVKKYGSMKKIAVKTEADCGTLIRACCIEAGFDPGNFTTVNEVSVLSKTERFEDPVSVTSSTVLYNGDVLVTKVKGHTVAVVSGRPRSVTKDYLSKGDKGDDVKKMQTMLIAVGFSCGSCGADGSFGNDTDKAVRAFQKFYGLAVDGNYGPKSKAKLESVYNSKLSASAPVKSNAPAYKVGSTYTLQVELKVRTGAGTNYSAKKHSQLTADGQKHDKDNDGCLDAGTAVTCKEVKKVGSDIWIRTPSGWLAAYYNGQVYVK